MKTCLFVGIDTHKDSHTAAVLDNYFNTACLITFANSYSGFDKFMEKVGSIAENGSISYIFYISRAHDLFKPPVLSSSII